MKKLRLYLLLGAILCCILVFAGCGPKTLDRPTGVRVDTEKMELTWDEVENARLYSVEINGEADATHNNPYSISKLKAGEYEFRVKALGDGDAYADSDWSEPVTFVKEAETGSYIPLSRTAPPMKSPARARRRETSRSGTPIAENLSFRSPILPFRAVS